MPQRTPSTPTMGKDAAKSVPPIRKNERFTVTIEDLTEDGSGIGRSEGYIWFIKDTVIGDIVEASAMKMKRSYGFARLVRVIKPSDRRREPACPAARQCGGCQLQAMSYEEGLRFKENKVLNNLKRIGGIEDPPLYPIIGMEKPWRYRNKAQFPFGTDREGRIITGFYAGRTHDIIRQDDCLLGVEENARILAIIKNYMEKNRVKPYNEETRQGLMRHVLIRKGFKTGQLMVCLVINGERLPALSELTEELGGLDGMTSISCCINRRQTNVILDGEIRVLYGLGYITDRIGEITYRISPRSFYQVNPEQTEKLYNIVLEYAGLTGRETVWDLYCGIGTISLFLAQRAGRVYGVEVVSQAVADARENARLNGLDNVEFLEGRAEEVLPRQYEENNIRGDVIVVDPPRKGCDEACLETIVKMEPCRVVYVSCDSATLARDLRYLRDRGYELEKARCCDMFPWTGHVETVCLLSNTQSKKKESYITLDVEMADYYRIKNEGKNSTT